MSATNFDTALTTHIGTAAKTRQIMRIQSEALGKVIQSNDIEEIKKIAAKALTDSVKVSAEKEVQNV